ncbi:hypothetical protein WN982_26270 [Paraburkholderia sp. IMGN_8]|uniref:hypothetical protein n=1 Tax=Paraburkholderia sp. IMGN_8 TaxID=3136564 RepID=UPI003100E7FF
MVFPQGGISPNGSLQPHKPGLEWLWRNTGATLVEIKIAGAEKSKLFAKSGSQWWPKITLTVDHENAFASGGILLVEHG